MKQKIAIIGSGNMGQAIAQGLLRKKIVTNDQLFLTDSQTNNNTQAAQNSQIIVLAVKPQKAQVILHEMKSAIIDQLIISIMAGITIDAIQQALGKKTAVVRVMPNLAAKIGESMSVWVKSKQVTGVQEKIVQDVLSAIGKALEVQSENQIDAATAISGSGPAYFFYFTELLEKAAQKLGFSQEEAKLLTEQTFFASSELLKKSNNSAQDLRQAVTSKGGTTEAAVQSFQKAGLQDIVEKSIFAAVQRAHALGESREKE